MVENRKMGAEDKIFSWELKYRIQYRFLCIKVIPRNYVVTRSMQHILREATDSVEYIDVHVCVCVWKKKRKHWKQRHNVRKKKKNRERGKETECGSSISEVSLVVCAKGQPPPWPITHSNTQVPFLQPVAPQYTLTSFTRALFSTSCLLLPRLLLQAGKLAKRGIQQPRLEPYNIVWDTPDW